MKNKDLKPGMVVMHEDWDSRTSSPMLVVEKNGEIFLKDLTDPSLPLTEPRAGGESDDGWVVTGLNVTDQF